LFSSKLLKEDQDYKGDPLYTSAILPICVAFSDEVLDDDVDEMQMANASLRALQRVAACLWSLKVSTENLQSLLPLQQDPLRGHILAYTAAHMRPKAHYGLHLSAQIEKMNKVIDCFCCERKHKAYKGLAQKTFFRTVLCPELPFRNGHKGTFFTHGCFHTQHWVHCNLKEENPTWMSNASSMCKWLASAWN
jgi:hypothetical protein